MRLRNDDQLHSVEDTFLGPPGYSLPFRVRYRSYGVGFAVFIAILALEREAGIGLSFGSIAWCLLLTVAITTGIMQVVTHDRPLRALVVTFWQELNGPRPPAMIRYRLDARRVRLERRARRGPGGPRSLLSARFRPSLTRGARRPPADRGDLQPKEAAGPVLNRLEVP